VIEQYAVAPDLLRISVVPLSVSGHWSQIVQPGLLLCSEELYYDDDAYEAELKRTFASRLNNGGS